MTATRHRTGSEYRDRPRYRGAGTGRSERCTAALVANGTNAAFQLRDEWLLLRRLRDSLFPGSAMLRRRRRGRVPASDSWRVWKPELQDDLALPHALRAGRVEPEQVRDHQRRTSLGTAARGRRKCAYTFNDNWSPRVGISVDPWGNRKTKVTANFGRYTEALPLDIAIRSLSAEFDFPQ